MRYDTRCVVMTPSRRTLAVIWLDDAYAKLSLAQVLLQMECYAEVATPLRQALARVGSVRALLAADEDEPHG